MDTLPAEFVGPSSRLAPLVQLMCEVSMCHARNTLRQLQVQALTMQDML